MTPMVLTAANLVVIDIKADHLTPEIQAWKQDREVLCAESCARQVFYGLEEDFAGFSDPVGRAAKRREGKDAYVFLLKLISGFKSPRFGETHIVSQFFDRWKKVSRDPFFHRRGIYEPFVGQIRKDANYTRNRLMPAFAKPNIELIARDLSGERPGDKIVVVGDLNLQNRLSATTERVIRASENRQKRYDGFLALTHPDTSVLARLGNSISLLRDAGKIRSAIECFDYSKIAERVGAAHRVYVCSPMGEHPRGEERLVDAWRKHARRDAAMVHVRGTVGTVLASSGIWRECALDGYVAPERIEEKRRAQARLNDQIVRNVETVFGAIASIRAEGRQVHETELKKRAPDVFATLER